MSDKPFGQVMKELDEAVNKLGVHIQSVEQRINDSKEVIDVAMGVMMLIGLELEEKDTIEHKLWVRVSELAMETALPGRELAGQACDEILSPRIFSDEDMSKRMNAFIQVVGIE